MNKQTASKFLAASLALALATSANTGCALTKKTLHSAQEFWIEETLITPGRKKYTKTEFNSDHPADYILPNGKGIAIPSVVEHDLYISPFAPDAGYVQSKKPPKSEVICPFSGKILILGERKYVAEKEL